MALRVGLGRSWPGLGSDGGRLNFLSPAQQISISLGVLLASELLRLKVWVREGDASVLLQGDFSFAFMCIAATVPLALLLFLRLPADVGSEMRGPG